MVLGANDEQGMVVKGSSVAFASISWQWAYEDQIRRLDTLATNAGSRVLWVGLPVMEPNFYRQGVVVLNSLFAKVARSVPGVTFLPTWSLFADEHGAFQATALVNRVPTVVRSSDGIHFSYVGENVFATFVTDEIATLYHVRLKPLSPAYPTR